MLQIKLQIFNRLLFSTSKGRTLFFPRKWKCAGIQPSFWKEFLLSFSAHMTLCYAFWSLQKIDWLLYKLQLKSILFLIQKTKTLKFKTQEYIQVYPKYSNTLLCGKLPNIEICWFNDQVFICLTHSKIQYFFKYFKTNVIFLFYFTILYWFCHTWILFLNKVFWTRINILKGKCILLNKIYSEFLFVL